MGAMAASPGGRVPATNICEMPEKEMPTIPTLWWATHGCEATIWTAS
jgi:hypothetical protein